MRRLSYIVFISVLYSACSGSSTTPSTLPTLPTPSTPTTLPTPAGPPSRWDLNARGVPRFITHHYVDLTYIERISRFRSGFGHDYSDDVERCRSMKHYFVPRYLSIDSSTMPVSSPMTGAVERVREEWAGVQIEIQADEYPAFRVILFHVNAAIPLEEGTRLEAGQRIGTHVGNQTASDVAIVVDSTEGRRYVSWFDVITDGLMADYVVRGVTSRESAIISRAERDSSPLTCNGEAFVSPGSLPNWVNLR